MTKRIVMALMAIAIFASTVVAESGFEFGITFPIGASISMPVQKIKNGLDTATAKNLEDTAYKTSAGFEWGATLQIGYMFAIGNDMGISALLDMGYHRDVFAFSSKEDRINFGGMKEVDVRTSFEFDTLQIGLLPKFRIKNIAIGLGGGIKIPLGGNQYGQETSFDYITGKPDANNLRTTAEGLTKKMINDSFNPSTCLSAIIPYLKITFDYMLPIDEKTSLTFGAYVGYDFKLDKKIGEKDYDSIFKEPDLDKHYDNYDNVGFSAIDIGIQIGLRFGPSAA